MPQGEPAPNLILKQKPGNVYIGVDYRTAMHLDRLGVIDVPLAEVKPLTITDDSGAHARNFKESWSAANYKKALVTTDLYEAMGNPIPAQLNTQQVRHSCASWHRRVLGPVGCV